MLKKLLCGIALAICCAGARAQQVTSFYQEADSLYIQETEKPLPPKVLHAEPLYIDLIRDLGARKGEREWNVGMGITDNLDYDTYETLIEYEFAPVNRLGLEVEVPVTFIAKRQDVNSSEVPSHRVESLKLAAQYSFLVKPRHNLSAAVGYINEFELFDLNDIRSDRIVRGNVFNPFLVVAKRWGNNFHTLVYTGPVVEKSFYHAGLHTGFQVNSNFHYMITGTRNFMGIELNKEFADGDFDMTIRLQLRVGIADNLMIGIVGGIPISRENERFSTFARIIWEPDSRLH